MNCYICDTLEVYEYVSETQGNLIYTFEVSNGVLLKGSNESNQHFLCNNCMVSLRDKVRVDRGL